MGDVPSPTAPEHPIPLSNPQHFRDSIPTSFSSLAFRSVPWDKRAPRLHGKRPKLRGDLRGARAGGRNGGSTDLVQGQSTRSKGRSRLCSSSSQHPPQPALPLLPQSPAGAPTLPPLSVPQWESQLSSHIDSGPSSVPLNLRPSAANKKWQRQPWPGT